MAFSLRILSGLVFAVLAPGVSAQSTPDSESADYAEETFLEEVIVTGTRIARRDFNTPSPLTSIGEEFIDFTNQPTLEDTLNQMPQVFPSFGRASNNPGNGTAQVDLRGFGAGRSLVLLNGRRVAPSGTGNAVDLNNIPRFLIERVEIITGGTSAVYGSDAIAGVVNFITKSDFTGIGVEAGFSVTEEWDAETWEVNFAWGHDFENGAGNIAVYANYIDREPLLAGEREFTRYAWVDDWEGNLIQGGSTRTPAGVVNWPQVDLGNWDASGGRVTFDPDGTPREFDFYQDAYNYQPVNYLQIPLTRYTAGAMGHYDVSNNFEGYFEASFVRNDVSQNLAAVPANSYLEVNLDSPVLVPENQQFFAEHYACDVNLACISFSRRMIEVGERIMDQEQDYTRIVAGVRGDFGDDWYLDAWVTWTKGDSVRYLRNDVSRSRFQQGMLVDPATGECYDPSGGCVPLNVFGEGNISTEGADFLRFAPYENVTERTFLLASAFVSGSPADTWAGPLDVSIGVEWRSDDTSYRADDALFSGDAMGYGGSAPVEGIERIYEVYGEALIPLLSGKKWAQNLELELGARYTKTNNSDGYWTYKAGSSWEVLDGLIMRAMYQRSIRAPNSQELFEEQGKSEWHLYTSSDDDPCSASADPVGNGVVEKCLIQGLSQDQIGVFEATPYYSVDFYWGGNPDLLPEEGKTWTAGFVISPAPLPGWTFTMDYFQMELTDTIGDIFADVICFDSNNTENVFCENLVRDATGNISEAWELTSNRGVLETTGVDTQIQYTTDLPDWMALTENYANLSVNLFWTHLFTWKSQENPATEILECTGLFGWPCMNFSNPENRVTTNFNYLSGPFEVYLSWRWIDGMDNAAPLGAAIFGWGEPDLAITDVPDRHYLDLGFAWTWRESYQLRFGISNLLETEPVMMADQAWSNNTDENLYDVFGRSYYLRLSAQF
jgi:outer membrane receptor protein involved in Fe transport